MTEKSDKPSVDGLMKLVDDYRYVLRVTTNENGSAYAAIRAYAERLAALAGPLEQPQEPTSDKSYPVVAVGKDLPPALPPIRTNEALILGRWYWCRVKVNPAADWRPYQVCSVSGIKYVNCAGSRMWCDPTNDQFLDHYEALGPIAGPSSEPLSQNKPAASSESSVSVPKEQQ